MKCYEYKTLATNPFVLIKLNELGDDGWEMEMVPDVFANYLHNFNWSDITLDNGKYLFLLENEDYLFFQIFDKEKMEDGKVDWHGINW
jgi:hypothetical protein